MCSHIDHLNAPTMVAGGAGCGGKEWGEEMHFPQCIHAEWIHFPPKKCATSIWPRKCKQKSLTLCQASMDPFTILPETGVSDPQWSESSETHLSLPPPKKNFPLWILLFLAELWSSLKKYRLLQHTLLGNALEESPESTTTAKCDRKAADERVSVWSN